MYSRELDSPKDWRKSSSRSRDDVGRTYHPPQHHNEPQPQRREDRYKGSSHSNLQPFSPSSDFPAGAPPPRSGQQSNKPTDRVYFPSRASDISQVDSQLTGSETWDGAAVNHLDSPDDSAAVYRLASPKYNKDADIRKPSPHHRLKLNQWYEKRFPTLSQEKSEDTTSEGPVDSATLMSMSDDTGSTSDEGSSTRHTVHDGSGIFDVDDTDYLKTKQSVAWMSIVMTAIQLLILMLQLALCGLATLEVNPMVGPFPDAFSEWGGTNAYLMLRENQWWRIVTPGFLHVGVVHLLANAVCQLGSVALFEREWGSFRWTALWLISTIGCSTFSAYFDPNNISVGSSGALMGMYAAKLAQVMTLTCFHVDGINMDDVIRLDQLSSILCGLLIVSMLSSFTYIEWSGHLGGLVVGFTGGMVLLSNPITNCCVRFLWVLVGLSCLAASIGFVLYDFIERVEPDADLADACDYFRSLFPEGYYCGCLWN